MSDDRLARAEFVVEATDYERLCLWLEWADEADNLGSQRFPRIPWEQDSLGYMKQVGELAGHPVNVCLTFARINGKQVAFWEAVSNVIDHAMIEAWLKTQASPRWDSGTRLAYTNAMNFHHCIEHCRGEPTPTSARHLHAR